MKEIFFQIHLDVEEEWNKFQINNKIHIEYFIDFKIIIVAYDFIGMLNIDNLIL